MNPETRSLLTLVAVGVAGVLALVLGWLQVARTVFVPLQLPGVVSGSIAGIALLGAGAAFVATHLERRASARKADLLDDLLDEAAALAGAGIGRKRRRRR